MEAGGAIGVGRRVLLMAQALTQGGSERQLAATALSLKRGGYEVEVAVMRSGGIREQELRSAGIPIHVFPVTSFGRNGLVEGVRLAGFLRRKGYEVVHSFDAPANVLAAPAGRMAGVKAVVTSQRGHRDLVARWLRRALRWTDRMAGGIVVNCEYLLRYMEEEEGVKRERLHLCYNGLDTKYFRPEGERAKVGFGSGAVVIGTLCALRAEKNLGVLVEAFGKVAVERPEVCLLIVGSGPMKEGLVRQVEEAGLGGRVHFEASVAGTAPWYRAMDIFVLPSQTEAFSNSVIEAMGCGVAVVVSAVGGNPELVADGRGLMFEATDAEALAGCLLGLIQEVGERERMAGRALEWVQERLEQGRMGARMGEIYEQVLERRGR